jgi:hypothetical protein
MRVRVRDKIYKSVKEVAEVFDMTEEGVYGAISKGKADLIGLGQTKPKKVTIGPVEFRSMRSASEALGLPRKAYADIISRGGAKRKAMLDEMIARFIEKVSQQ